MAGSNDSPKKNDSTTMVGFHVQETSTLIAPERPDGTSYVEWALNAQNKISERKRWGYISRTKATPKNIQSEEYKAWEDENCLVKSGLLDEITKDIRSFFLRLSTVKEIWEVVTEAFSRARCIKGLSTTLLVISVHQNGGLLSPTLVNYRKLVAT